MGYERGNAEMAELLRSVYGGDGPAPLTRPIPLYSSRPPAPEPDPVEYVTEEPTGLLNQHGRPIYRVRRLKLEPGRL